MATKIEYIISLTGNFQKKMAKAQGAVGKFNQKINKLTPSIGGLGKQLIGFASVAAIGGVLISTGKNIAQYEANIASLSAITGVSGEALAGFEDKIKEVSSSVRGDSVQIAKAFELVGSAKPELLKSADGLAAVTKSSFILAKASGETLESSVQSLTGTLNQFNLGADKADEVINILAAGSKEGAAAVPLISQALDKFGTVAASMNLDVADSVGLIETLAEKNIKGAEAGTALRNVLSRMDIAGALPKEALDQFAKFGVNIDVLTNKALPLNTRLKEFSKIAEDGTALTKVFGLENKVAGQVILQNVDKVAKYTEAVRGTNVAQEQSEKNTSTLNDKLEQLGNVWNNVFTTSSGAGSALNVVKDIIVFLTDNLTTIITVIGFAIGAFIAFKLVVVSITVVTGLWNAAIVVATAAQWLWNAAMNANPISLIVIGIFALIAAVALIVKSLGGWSAIWDKITKTFTVDNMIAGFKSVGQTIVSAVLFPIQKMLELISLIPGVGQLTKGALESIKKLRGAVDEVVIPEKVKEVVLTDAQIKGRDESIEAIAAGRKAAAEAQKVPTAPGVVGADTKAVSGAKSGITSQAPKIFNINIEQLIDDVTISTTTLTEGTNKVKQMLTEALIEATNDLQTSVN